MNPMLLALATVVGGANLTIDGGGVFVTPESVKVPIIIHVSDIDDNSAKEFTAQMEAAQMTGQTVVPIYISSYGGSVYAVLEMIDAIKKSKIPVATIAVGKAMSAGAILLSMGSPGMRFAAPHSVIMLHEVSSGAFGKVTDMASGLEEAKRVNALIFKLMCDSLGKPPDYFQKLMAEKGRVDWFITPEEALALGIVDKIAAPDLHVKIKVQTVME